jgi:hypothetical protein
MRLASNKAAGLGKLGVSLEKRQANPKREQVPCSAGEDACNPLLPTSSSAGALLLDWMRLASNKATGLESSSQSQTVAQKQLPDSVCRKRPGKEHVPCSCRRDACNPLLPTSRSAGALLLDWMRLASNKAAGLGKLGVSLEKRGVSLTKVSRFPALQARRLQSNTDNFELLQAGRAAGLDASRVQQGRRPWRTEEQALKRGVSLTKESQPPALQARRLQSNTAKPRALQARRLQSNKPPSSVFSVVKKNPCASASSA